MKKILIVTSVYTGGGHKSISDSLMEQFASMPDVEAQVIDGFELMGRTGLRLSRLYGFLTRRTPALFNAGWRFTMRHPPDFTAAALLCSRRFTECIRRFHPDLILTVHSLFNAVLTQMLDRQGLHIPDVVLQADFINIHSTWCNPRAHMTICPTPEACEASLRQGMPPEKLTTIGFPVRSRFCTAPEPAPAYDATRPLRCLLMSGGEGTGSLRAYAEALLNNTDATLTIICGRNKKLHSRLRRTLPYGERVRVLGFVPDVEREMRGSDLLITRGSPNTLTEAAAVNLPFIVTGPLPEQERDNPRLMQERGFGVVSRSPGDLPELIRGLLADGGAQLEAIRAAQRLHRCTDAARRIAEYAAALTEPLAYEA